MPIYGVLPPVALGVGDTVTVWSAEQPTAGTILAATSQSVALAQPPGKTEALSVAIQFSGVPGTFEVDLLTSDVDTWPQYVQKATVTAVNASNCARMEITGIKAKFAALQLVSLANSVTVSAQISA